MRMCKVAVILPCLNVVAYIDECIQSILNQSLKDIEIIVIDAGSTDGTKEKLHCYAGQDDRIHILDSSQKSYGFQVNMGLEKASAETICIVDTDDFLAENALFNLYQPLIEQDLDYVKGYAKAFYTKGKERFCVDICKFFVGDEIEDQIINPSQMPSLVYKDHFIWQGLYRKELLDSVRLNESAGAAFQDQGFCLQVYQKAKRAKYINECIYYYRKDNENASTYNTKGFEYTYNEFTANLKYIDKDSIDWLAGFYHRLLDQTKGRFEVMACSGYYWENAEVYIKKLTDCLLIAWENGLFDGLSNGEKDDLLNIIHNSNEYFNVLLSKQQEIIKKYHQMLNFVNEKNIVIVGNGAWGTFASLLLKDKTNIVGIADNNSMFWNMTKWDFLVQSVEYYTKKEGLLYIIANKKYHDSLFNQLCELGVNSSDIYTYDLGVHFELFKEAR